MSEMVAEGEGTGSGWFFLSKFRQNGMAKSLADTVTHRSPAGPDRPLSRASRGKKKNNNNKHKEPGSSPHSAFPNHISSSPRAFGRMQGQNLVPRPKAPQGSWVASRGCCGAPAARQALHPPPRRRPRPHSCGFPERAPDEDWGAQRQSLQNADRRSCSCRRGRCRGIGRSVQPPPELQRRPGLSPQERAQRGRAFSWDRGLTSAAATAASAQGSLSSGQGAGEPRGEEGCPSEFPG